MTNTLSEKNIESFGPVSVNNAKDNLEFKEKELNLSSESNEQLKALKIELENNFKKLSKMENKLKLEILNKSKEIETLQLTVLDLSLMFMVNHIDHHTVKITEKENIEQMETLNEVKCAELENAKVILEEDISDLEIMNQGMG